MLYFLIEDFDVFNEHSNGHEFIIFLVLFFKAQRFLCQWAILEYQCVNKQTDKSFRYHREHYVCNE